MAGWVYGAGSGGGGTPGGEDKDIQFNNNGRFSGSTNLLITDGSGSLSASTTISASSFHGDGSNLTGLTASAVNVADGPEFSLQFRRDDPITGEISGSGNLTFTSNTLLALTGTLEVVGNVSASINVSGSGFHGLTADFSSSLASSGVGQELQLGSGANRRIGAAEIDGSDYLMASNSDGRIVLSSSSGIELVTDTTDGVGSFGSPVIVYTSQAGSDVAASITHEGNISASQNISGANVYVAAGNSIFLNGSTETFKITNNGTNFDINGANIILNATTHVSASTDLSASGFFGEELEMTSNAVVKGQVIVGPGTGVGYVSANGDSNTRIRFGAAGLGSDSMSIEAGGKAFIVLDENGRDELTLGTGVADVVHVSGSLTASVGLRVSASAADGQDIFVGAGNDRTIGVLQEGGDDFFVVGHDAGIITLSSSSGVEIVTDPTEGLGLFASPIKVFNDSDGNDTRLFLSTAGVVSASSTIHGTNFIRKQSPTVHGSDFSASNAASLYLVKVDSGPVTASLPGLTSAAQIGETYTFKDYLGSGSVNSVHISPSGSQEIDEGSQLTIEQAFGAATVTAVSSSTKGFSWVVTSTT